MCKWNSYVNEMNMNRHVTLEIIITNTYAFDKTVNLEFDCEFI